MSKITKDIAKDVSKAMTKTLWEKAAEADTAFKNAVRKMALSRVPNEIVEMYNSDTIRPYINYVSSIQVCGNGFNYEWVTIKPIPWENDRTTRIAAKNDESVKLTELQREYKKLEKKAEELYTEINETLYYTLKTYKNVEKHFPEAIPFLPQLSTSTAVAVNVDSLRSKLRNF